MSSIRTKKTKVVNIYGAGIAGLAAAHELVLRSRETLEIHVYESDATAGGFAKSARLRQDGGVPTEYSWRGFGPWYHNAFALMQEIELTSSSKEKKSATVYTDRLSLPIEFAMPRNKRAPGETQRQSATNAIELHDRFLLGCGDSIRVVWGYVANWLAGPRRRAYYATQNAAAELHAHLASQTSAALMAATFGPWIGIDKDRCSVYHLALFFRKNFYPGPPAPYLLGNGIRQGGNSGWRLLNAPSNEAWFDPWVRFLQAHGVHFHFGYKLRALETEEPKKIHARFHGSLLSYHADTHICALGPFAAAEVFAQSEKAVRTDRECAKMPALIADGPHIQVSFQIEFDETVYMPTNSLGGVLAVIVPDAPFDLTLYPVGQAWRQEVLATLPQKAAASIWSGTACTANTRSPFSGKTLAQCTKDEFFAEVIVQLHACAELDCIVREYNAGRGLRDFRIRRLATWHTWQFPSSDRGGGRGTIASSEPKWVNSTRTQAVAPLCRTSVPALYLAGGHTRTHASIWSMEGAVESGRRAAMASQGMSDHEIAPRLFIRRRRLLLRLAALADDGCFALGLPPFFACLLVLVFIVLLLYAMWRMWS